MVDISQVKVGSTTYNIKDNSALPKLTNEWNKELATGSNGKVCIGKFAHYDTNTTIEISSTTSTTYNATIVIATQNIAPNTTAGTIKVNVYGDNTNTITPRLVVFRPYGSADRYVEVYADLPGWSKNRVHIFQIAAAGTATNILESISSIPTVIEGKLKITPVNTFDYDNLLNKPTLDEIGENTNYVVFNCGTSTTVI